jgi:hypothetical protein
MIYVQLNIHLYSQRLSSLNNHYYLPHFICFLGMVGGVQCQSRILRLATSSSFTRGQRVLTKPRILKWRKADYLIVTSTWQAVLRNEFYRLLAFLSSMSSQCSAEAIARFQVPGVDTLLLALARTVLKISGRLLCGGFLADRSVSGRHDCRVIAFWAEDRLFLEDLSKNSAQLIKRKYQAAECHIHRNLLTHVSGPFRSNLDRLRLGIQ